MKTEFIIYNLILSLWVGGNALFTFLVTPVIFKMYGRDEAGKIVGTLFPLYFTYMLVLSILAFLIFWIFIGIKGKIVHQATLVMIIAAVIINVFVSFKLYPDIKRAKQEITSFEHTFPDSPVRRKFKRLHRLSAVLNTIILADGITLLCISSLLKGSE
ncbi:DUF4149 domain-containing protein [bacterium]|nr:MAG: DUF4149 domain-containing protein [bacterium]